MESMAVPTGSVQQSRDIYGESTTVYVSISLWQQTTAVYGSIGEATVSLGESTDVYGMVRVLSEWLEFFIRMLRVPFEWFEFAFECFEFLSNG